MKILYSSLLSRESKSSEEIPPVKVTLKWKKSRQWKKRDTILSRDLSDAFSSLFSMDRIYRRRRRIFV